MLNYPIYLIFHPLLWRRQQRQDMHLRRRLGCYSFVLVSNSIITDFRRRGYLGCSFVHQFDETGTNHEKGGHQISKSDWPSVSCLFWHDCMSDLLTQAIHFTRLISCNGKRFALILCMRQPLLSMAMLPRFGSPSWTLYFLQKCRSEQKYKYSKESFKIIQRILHVLINLDLWSSLKLKSRIFQ